VCGVSVMHSLINSHVDLCLAKKNNTETVKAKRPKLLEEYLGDADGSRVISRTDVPGLVIIYEYISEEVEDLLILQIDSDERTPWHYSTFNGHCMSKSYGVKTLFGLPDEERRVRKFDESKGEYDVPAFLREIPQRLPALTPLLKNAPLELHTFTPNECNCNSYESASGHYLKAHFDDRALSGPILMNLSMGCDAHMTYHSPHGEEISVSIPRRSLQLVMGPSRWTYMHSIKSTDISGPRRVSVTWRQAGSRNYGIRNK